MSHRLDYETRPGANPSRRGATRWVLATLIAGALGWATAIAVTGISFDLSMSVHNPSTARVISGWAAMAVIPALVAFAAGRHVLRAGKRNDR